MHHFNTSFSFYNTIFSNCVKYAILGFLLLKYVSSGISRSPTLPHNDVVITYRNKLHRKLNCTIKSPIPCLFWMTTKNVSELETTYRWIPRTIIRNADWHIHISDDNEMDTFMERVFRGTKVLWAFNMINRKLPPARTDIWRYAVLWVYGGGYMDIDSDIRTPFNEIVASNVSFLFGGDKRKRHQCYIPTFHLHESRLNSINASYALVPNSFNRKYEKLAYLNTEILHA